MAPSFRPLLAAVWIAGCAQRAPSRVPPTPPPQPVLALAADPIDLYDAAETLGTIRLLARGTSGHFAFSPDGAWVVYIAAQQGLVAVRPDGSDRRVLAPPSPEPSFFRITPDSTHVVYAAVSRILAVPIGGGRATTVASDLGSVADIQISPDSQWVFHGPIAGEVSMAPLDGTQSHTLLPPHPSGVTYRITPDSQRVVHRAQHILSQKLDGTDVVDLTPGLAQPALLFLAEGGAVVADGRTAYFAPYDGSGAVPAPSDRTSFSWPPKPVAGGFAFHDTAGNLHYVDLETRAATRVNPPLGPSEEVSSFYGSTDRHIIYAILSGAASSTRAHELHVTDLDTRVDRPVATAAQSGTVVIQTTPDGTRAIVHVSRARGTMAFFAIDLASFEVTRLTRDLRGWGNFEISADSRHVVFDVQTGASHPATKDLRLLALSP